MKFVDLQSPTYAKNKRNCEFWITGTGRGVLESPRHSLPPNTTCLYHLQGTEGAYRPLDQIQMPRRLSSNISPRFRVWISILKFDFASEFGFYDENAAHTQPIEDCTGMLRIWDGPLREPPVCKDFNCERDITLKPYQLKGHQNFTNVIARFCRGTIPKSCDHGILNDTKVRPCLKSESFLSNSDFVTLELWNTESTVLRPLNFKLRYEFVDLFQYGVAMSVDSDSKSEYNCNRRFVSNSIDKRDPIIVRSVRNVFLFGRGGADNLKYDSFIYIFLKFTLIHISNSSFIHRCIYRFEGQRGERVKLVIRKIMTGNKTCASKIDTDINRSYCFGDSSIRLGVS